MAIWPERLIRLVGSGLGLGWTSSADWLPVGVGLATAGGTGFVGFSCGLISPSGAGFGPLITDVSLASLASGRAVEASRLSETASVAAGIAWPAGAASDIEAGSDNVPLASAVWVCGAVGASSASASGFALSACPIVKRNSAFGSGKAGATFAWFFGAFSLPWTAAVSPFGSFAVTG